MRRKEREVTSHAEILEILQKCDVLHLGINTVDYPYIVPMNFGIESDGNIMTLWLHCAKEGLKLDLLQRDSHVGFEADCSHKLILGEKTCNCSMEYESVMGYGNIYICEDIKSKQHGLEVIVSRYKQEKEFEFSVEALGHVFVLRLDVLQITGKRRKSI